MTLLGSYGEKNFGPQDHCSHFEFSILSITWLFTTPKCNSIPGKLRIMYLNNLRTKGKSLFFVYLKNAVMQEYITTNN